jgi:hypothetical protein
MAFHIVFSIGFQTEQWFAWDTGYVEAGEYIIAFSLFGVSMAVGVVV